eukprot:1057903-Pelagomonas_calceolata.AAC.1
MGIWTVARHAPGRPNIPSLVLRRRAPSNFPPEAPMGTESMSSANVSGKSLNGIVPKLGC